jgi:hypothetical protein
MDEWYARTMERVSWRDAYSPGAHCAYCQRTLDCAAKANFLRQSAGWLLGIDGREWSWPTTPAERGDLCASLIERCRLLETTIEAVRGVVKAQVMGEPGSQLHTTDGRTIGIKTQTQRPIFFEQAFDVLRDIVPDGRWNEVVCVRKQALEKLVKGTCGLAKKGEAWNAVIESLQERDALGIEVVEKMEIRKPIALENE